MNRGKIIRYYNGEFVVKYTYLTERKQELKQELPIHPYYKNADWIEEMIIEFQYATECERHYPTLCSCKDVTLFALPIIQQSEKNIFSKFLNMFRNGNKNR